MRILATTDKVLTAPKQAKLLGATIRGLGVVTTVSSTLFSCYALIEDEAGREHHRYLVDLKREEVELPAEVKVDFLSLDTKGTSPSFGDVSVRLAPDGAHGAIVRPHPTDIAQMKQAAGASADSSMPEPTHRAPAAP